MNTRAAAPKVRRSGNVVLVVLARFFHPLSVLRFVHRVQRMLQRLGRVACRFGVAMPATTRARGRAEPQPSASLPDVERRLVSTCAAAAMAAAAEPAPASTPDVRADHPAIAPRRAAVLVALFEEAEDAAAGRGPHVWLTRRADHLSAHAGEVCLPGGKRDPADASDAACALREAEEELGLPRASARVVCALPPLLSKHRLSVHPVVAVVSPSFRPLPNPDEVAEAFSMPLAAFLERENHLHYDFFGDAGPTESGSGSGDERRGGGGARAEGEDGAAAAGAASSSAGRPAAAAAAAALPPKLRMHSFAWGDHVVWGLTAEILVRVARLSLGREPAFPLLAAPPRRRRAASSPAGGGGGGGGGGGTDYALLWAPDGGKRARVGGGPASGRWDRLFEEQQRGGGGDGGAGGGAPRPAV